MDEHDFDLRACMYVGVYVCVGSETMVHACMCMHKYVCVCAYTYICSTHIHPRMHVYICIHTIDTHLHAQWTTNRFIYTHMYIHTCILTYMHTCSGWTNALTDAAERCSGRVQIYAYIHTYIHVYRHTCTHAVAGRMPSYRCCGAM